jgi:hypothetical protein
MSQLLLHAGVGAPFCVAESDLDFFHKMIEHEIIQARMGLLSKYVSGICDHHHEAGSYLWSPTLTNPVTAAIYPFLPKMDRLQLLIGHVSTEKDKNAIRAEIKDVETAMFAELDRQFGKLEECPTRTLRESIALYASKVR